MMYRALWIVLYVGMCAHAEDGVHVRFRLDEPEGTRYRVRVGGTIHNAPWYLPEAVVPSGSERDWSTAIPSGEFTPWLDLSAHAGKLLHGRLQRSGGVAELPNVTARFETEAPSERRVVVVELATAPDPATVRKRFEESFEGSLTSFLVSPDLERDAASLETASEMTARRLRWARRASGGKRVSPERLIVQTSFWAPQRPELNLREAEVLHLLGFNVVGNQTAEVRERFEELRVPGHTHDVALGPGATRDEIDELMKRHASRDQSSYAPGVPYGFSDEVCARPSIGDDPQGLEHFHEWLARRAVSPDELGVSALEDVRPIETPAELDARLVGGELPARRTFYLTSRFRQEAAVERLRWHTESFHRHFEDKARTSTLVADHPYFSGTGLGMGIEPNWTWGGHPLAIDWFALARAKAVDLIGIEDWMGLQYMYGPDSTWEGFQLMGFQASIFRSASRGTLPTIAWITPSDETNLRLKSASALCQGATHFFYWTYGPTATSTENYWSDLESAYDGIVHVTRALAAAEPILATGRPRGTRLALLYSVSSDLWQPFGYVHMLERRGLYFSLIHDQYRVDLLSEEDVDSGRLDDYDVLYTADPCISRSAAERIVGWVRGGGRLVATCAAGSLNEFAVPSNGLSEALGIRSDVSASPQKGRYSVRAGVNAIDYTDRIRLDSSARLGDARDFGVIGCKVSFATDKATVVGTFSDGSPAVSVHRLGDGSALYVGACPGIAYLKEARFVRDRLAERWPPDLRGFLNATARARGVPRLVDLSHPVVEAGVYDSARGTVLVLANFTYEPIERLGISLSVPHEVRRVRSVERGELEFSLGDAGSAYPRRTVSFTLSLGLDDIVLVE